MTINPITADDRTRIVDESIELITPIIEALEDKIIDALHDENDADAMEFADTAKLLLAQMNDEYRIALKEIITRLMNFL